MKNFYKLLLTTTVLSISGHAATKTIQYKIKSGDTLSQIAQKNGTTVSSIRKINKIKKDQKLKLGKELKVLAKVKTVNHTIKSGDTLSVLAVKNNTTVASIREENNLKKDEKLKLGKLIAIPTESIDIKKSKKIASAKKSKSKLKTKKKKTTKLASTKKSKIKSKKSKKNLKVASAKKSKIKTKKVAVAKKKKNIKVASKRKTQKKKLVDRLTSVKFTKANKPKTVKFTLGNALMSAFGNNKSTKMIKLAKNKLGRKYVWGATGKKNTFDCSGLTKFVCKANGIKIPRRAIQQSKYGKQISRSNLKPGDLIFFDTSKQKKGFVNHVGIYLGNDKFIHASSAQKKVVISPLHKNFYSKRYVGARRVSSL